MLFEVLYVAVLISSVINRFPNMTTRINMPFSNMTTKKVAGEAELDAVLAKLERLEAELAASQDKINALKTDVRAAKNLIADKKVITSETKKVAPAGEPIFETIFYIFLVFHIFMVLNCRFDKPWIPESDGFCSDLTHLITQYEFRGTFGRNYDLTAGNFINLIGTTLFSYVESVVKYVLEAFV